MGWLSKIRTHLPRRRRAWQYVSGRRRNVGFFIFCLLALSAGGYWYITNDARMQDEVQRYLSTLTGGQVEVGSAEFTVLSGIRVKKLRVFLPGEQVAFFRADELVIAHRPSALLLRGRLEPTEIVCTGPEVTLVQDLDSLKWNAQSILSFSATGRLKDNIMLVPIRLRDGSLVICDRHGSGAVVPVARIPLTVSVLPSQDGKTLQLNFQEKGGDQAIRGTGTIDVETGATKITGWGLPQLNSELTRQYHRWLERYELKGQVQWIGQGTLGALPPGAQVPPQRLTVHLVDVTMRLPVDQPGSPASQAATQSQPAPARSKVELQGVKGTLVFDPDGVQVESLTGVIPQAGGASFDLTGRYEGYGTTSPFKLKLSLHGLSLPLERELVEFLGPQYEDLQKQLAPAGRADLTATIERQADQPISVSAEADIKGMDIKIPDWPARLQNVKGKVELAGRTLRFKEMTASLGQSHFDFSGWSGAEGRFPDFQVQVTSTEVLISKEVHDALPRDVQWVHDAFRPRGKSGLSLDIARKTPGGPAATRPAWPTVHCLLQFNKDMSVEFIDFPYRLENMEGIVEIFDDRTLVRSVRASAGPMRCLINGTVGHTPVKDNDLNLTIQATDLPLDERLAKALPAKARALYDACRPAGKADVTDGSISRSGGGPIDFRVPLVLRDATLNHQQFPYRIDQAGGTMILTPQKVHIEHLVGRHGPARISIRGDAMLDPKARGEDLTVEAGELPLDEELRKAVPEQVRQGWDLLGLEGQTDVTVTLHAGLPIVAAAPTTAPASTTASAPSSAPAPGGYKLVLVPRDLRLKYRHFPYPLRRVTGTATIEPDRISLANIIGFAGNARIGMDGEICTVAGKERADLRLATDPMVIDEELLAVLPAGLKDMLGLRAGGTATLNLQQLHIAPLGEAASRSATAPATVASAGPVGPTSAAASTSAPTRAPMVSWSGSGSVALNDVVMEMGVGGKCITGKIVGEVRCDGPPETMSMAAEVELTKLQVGAHHMDKLSASLRKSPRSPLKIERVSGAAFGGQAAGFAEVRFGQTVQYTINLSVDNIVLSQLLNAGRAAPDPGLDVLGLMAGTLQMNATLGDDAGRRAIGKLHMSQAHLYQLPVLLGLLQVITLTLPSESAFDTADVDYMLKGNTLTFNEIHLSGSAISMVGTGTMDTKTERVKLTFLTGPPRKLPRLAGISDALDGLAGFMVIEVGGTLREPKTRTLPFNQVPDALQRIKAPTTP